MIHMDLSLPAGQAGMEHAVRDYLQRLAAGGDGTFNGMMDASLVRCDYAGRSLVLRFGTKRWMENPNGVIHGGVSAAMLDMTMGTLARYFTGGGMTPTVSLTVDYLRPIPVDTAVCMRAELSKLGHTLCYATGSAWTEGHEGELLCTASAVYYGDQDREKC